MKTRKLFTTLFASLLLVGLFGGCKQEDPAADVTIFYSSWIDTQRANIVGAYNFPVKEPRITQDFLERGTVLSYVKYNLVNPPVIHQLPLTSIQSDRSKVSVTMRLDLKLGFVEFLYGTVSSTQAVSFRYVLISGGAPIGARKAAIDYSDYEAVKKAYNLPD
ncbi:hypothetical protein LC612_43310 [Nostoc sp. CHAB 5834]|nr:hypothetical protein [Nostoc sp. CHAB 5834]